MSAPRRLRVEDLDALRGWSHTAPATGALTALGPEEEAFGWEDGGGLVVVLRGRRIVDEAELDLLWTRPDTRRQGWGGRMLRWWLARLVQVGVHRVFLEVRSENRPAVNLYAGLGFVEVGRRTGYYGASDARIFALQTSAETAEACDDENGRS